MLVLVTGFPLALGCVLGYVRLFLGAVCSQTIDLFKNNKQPIVNTALWTAYLDKKKKIKKNQWEEGDEAPSKGSSIPFTPCGC